MHYAEKKIMVKDDGRTTSVQVRLTPDELKLIKAAARFDGQTMSAWVRAVIIQAARKSGSK